MAWIRTLTHGEVNKMIKKEIKKSEKKYDIIINKLQDQVNMLKEEVNCYVVELSKHTGAISKNIPITMRMKNFKRGEIKK